MTPTHSEIGEYTPGHSTIWVPCQHGYAPAAKARNEQHNVFSVPSAPEGWDFSSKHTNVMKVERAVGKKKKRGFTSQTREWQHLIFMRRVGADDSAARRRAARGGASRPDRKRDNRRREMSNNTLRGRDIPDLLSVITPQTYLARSAL